MRSFKLPYGIRIKVYQIENTNSQFWNKKSIYFFLFPIIILIFATSLINSLWVKSGLIYVDGRMDKAIFYQLIKELNNIRQL